MKICFPVEQSEGLNSKVFGHFGSAPFFLVVNTEDRSVSEIMNRDRHHQHGACRPLTALGGAAVDSIVVGGIGAGALTRLLDAGITVYRAGASSVAENLALIRQGRLAVLQPHQVCGGHSHGGGCSH